MAGTIKTPDFLAWWKGNKRDFPWRKTNDPYRIWVSEVILQQTQAARGAQFYRAFLKKFPTVKKLAKVQWPQVLSVVRGLGYYHRFRNMMKTAKIVVKKFGGKFPIDYEALRKFPGIGDYTANAILAFAFGKDVPVIDTNVRRVLRHYFGTQSPTKGALRYYKKLALQLCPRGRAREFFQAIMDYASVIKKPCRKSFNKLGAIGLLQVAAAIIHQNGKILIQRRQNGKHLAGYWEFPGGKVEKGEDARACLKREIKEELGIEISVRPPFYKTIHAYSDRQIRLTFHCCQILLGRPKALENQKFHWIAPADLSAYRLAPADKPVAAHLTKSRHLY